MDSSKGAAAAAAVPPQVYEDFVPTTELVQEQDTDTLLLNLTGFKKEQVRVQLTKTGILKISGQRPIGQNKWLRFQKDFPVSVNCDKNKISAKFENGILYVKQPKLITSAEKIDEVPTTPDAQQPKKPTDHVQPQAQKKDEENAKSEKTTPTEESPKEEQKTPSRENEQKTEAKEVPEKDGNRTSSDSRLENDAKMTSAAALAEKLKMPRKVMNMTLVAILVLGIGIYVSNMMKSNNYQAEE